MTGSGSTLSPLWATILTTTVAVVGLLATQGFIDNRQEKLIGGLAALLVPLAAMAVNAVHHTANARVRAAQIQADAVRAAASVGSGKSSPGGRSRT
jgi:hypothetical protein